jgi:hypothetical protein
MNKVEFSIVISNSLSAVIGLLLMQTKYRGYTTIERLSLAFLIGALAVNAAMHVLDGRDQGASAEGLLSFAILFRFLTAALWRYLKCGKCQVTILCLAVLFALSGCSSLDREYSATYNMTTGETLAGVKLSAGTGQRSVSANVTGNLDWNTARRGQAKFFADK